MTIGEDRVRVTFNPSDNSLIHQIKHKTAELIDLCAQQVAETPEHRRLWAPEYRWLWALAMTSYEDAAMWAVKGATLK